MSVLNPVLHVSYHCRGLIVVESGFVDYLTTRDSFLEMANSLSAMPMGGILWVVQKGCLLCSQLHVVLAVCTSCMFMCM